METDRGAVLTVRAAARGIIDFREARLLDPKWWNRCYVLFREMVRGDDMQLQRGILDFHLALVGASGLSDDGFRSAQERAREAIFDMMGLVRPWEGMGYAERKKREHEGLLNDYIREFGDPRDPVFKQKEAEALAAWKEQIASRQPEETDLQRIMRLRREQESRLAILKQRLAQRRQGR